MIKLPGYFYKKSTLGSLIIFFCYITLLAPLYYIIAWLRYRLGQQQLLLKSAKVICVGNITLGGTGKTPICIALLKLLEIKGYKCCFLTKGYKRSTRYSLFAPKGNPDNLDYRKIGDEATILSAYADTFIVNKRYQLPASIEKYDYVISDDGLLDRSLYYHSRIMVIDGSRFFGNNHIFPAGPLRISPRIIIRDIDIIIINSGTLSDRLLLSKLNLQQSCSIYKTTIYSDDQPKPGEKYIAFSGLGNNGKFFNSLQENGYNIIKQIEFPDHYAYNENDIKLLLQSASLLNATLITTQKDIVKIPFTYHEVIKVLNIKVQLKEADGQEFTKIIGNLGK